MKGVVEYLLRNDLEVEDIKADDKFITEILPYVTKEDASWAIFTSIQELKGSEFKAKLKEWLSNQRKQGDKMRANLKAAKKLLKDAEDSEGGSSKTPQKTQLDSADQKNEEHVEIIETEKVQEIGNKSPSNPVVEIKDDQSKNATTNTTISFSLETLTFE